mmetsp:Transcript_162989/g.517682  ORF Transcript_162989/g.517682 Transcript_162989/m.517682 type:complete len:399 (+) Transcript_162989:120-1316(+)
MSEGGLRRRNVPVADDGGSKTQRAFEKLKSFDVYSKVHDDYLQKSQTGGAVSLVTAMILAFLFWAELAEFTSAEVEHSFSVDTSFTRRLPVSMNITLPSLRCDMVSVDTVDSKGESQLNVRGSMGRENLDRSGRFVPERVPKPGECLDCLEGAGEEHACCNTCSELKDAYVVKNLSYAHILESSEQCGAAVGCRIVGSIMVSKCSGNVHIALGESRLKGRALVHRFNVQEFAEGWGLEPDHPAMLQEYFATHKLDKPEWLDSPDQVWAKLRDEMEQRQLDKRQCDGWGHLIHLERDGERVGVLRARPGEQLRVTVKGFIHNSQGDSCIQQLFLVADLAIVAEVSDGVPGLGRDINKKVTITAPKQGGTYMLWRSSHLQYSMRDARNDFARMNSRLQVA